MNNTLANTSSLWFDQSLRSAIEELTLNHQDDTGFFVYNLDALAKHLAHLQTQDVVKLWFAVKANPLSRIIETLAAAGFNFDVASAGELQQVLAQGVSAQHILNTGPAKSKRQIVHFLKLGVQTFVAESINQLIWLNEAAIELEQKPTVLLRVQLQWPDGEKNPLGGNQLTPFGLSPQEWQHINLADFTGLDIAGLHIFQWGNMLSNEKMYGLWQQMVPELINLAQALAMDFRILDLGGGLGIDYLTSERELNWQQLIDDLAKIKSSAGVNEIWLELGRYAVANCGSYVVPIVDRKTNYNHQQLVLAAGINHIIRPAITEQPFPVTTVKASTAAPQSYELHGPLCTSLDKLGTLALPSDVSEGDFLIFGYCGAYGFTESMPFFLCHPIASEYVISGGNVECVRQGQPAEWYLA